MELQTANYSEFTTSDDTNVTMTTPSILTDISNSGVSDWAHVQRGFNFANYILTPTVLLVGVFGNTMTILTVTSREFSKMTSRYLLLALAISDTALILMQPFNKMFVMKFMGTDIRALSPGGCKLFFCLFRTAKMTSSWIIVIMCFERFVAVVFPLKAKRILTKKVILILIACDYMIIGIYNGVWTFSSLIVNGVCKPDVTTAETKATFRDFLLTGLAFYSIIPMGLMLVFTPVIVFRLFQKSRQRRHLNSPLRAVPHAAPQRGNKEIRASVVLTAIVVAFIVLVLPITVVHKLALWRSVSAFDTNTMDFYILREVAQILEQLNYSINFFLYIFCSDTFRKRAVKILCSRYLNRKIEPTTIVTESSAMPQRPVAGNSVTPRMSPSKTQENKPNSMYVISK